MRGDWDSNDETKRREKESKKENHIGADTNTGNDLTNTDE